MVEDNREKGNAALREDGFEKLEVLTSWLVLPLPLLTS